MTGVARTRITSAKVEALGSFAVGGPNGHALTVGPRVGAFLLRTRVLPTTNSLGETGTGPFGALETVAVVRAGATLGTGRGSWSPSLSLGWESELTHEMSALVDDRHAVVAAAGVSWTWARGRRLSLDWSLVRGLEGRRRASELTLVVIRDG